MSTNDKPQPVAWQVMRGQFNEGIFYEDRRNGLSSRPLYAHPPALAEKDRRA